ncbi:hypothetical protein [Streptomyces murinus]|uniref:hypothetical protein n=1 Tax=Streptomyces murinus TaxID=33900 RepID=UPI0018F5F4AF|nr:hypothetical protein [Streptomyces murinus]
MQLDLDAIDATIATYRQHPDLGFACCSAHPAADAAEKLVAENRRLRARVWELERPVVEANRNEVRQSFTELIAQAEQDRDYEGAFDVECRLRDREEQWKAEDAAAQPAAPAVRSDAV